MDVELSIPILTDADIVRARQQGREVASQLTFTPSDLTVIASAISELARNIFSYAGHGEIVVGLVERNGRRGVKIVARDEGPGIRDVDLALQDGYSTSGSLGLGLPGVRRLVDEFEIRTQLDVGTEITLRKWAR
ncbi:MAG TPA: anti-sigma regulatory factor [Gemmatimonadaceae bacterium]|jgi:Anti-sigma regulatory factor (Ser/Thr protein kinase)|nr:anti-sigma regulatory factor [Gemmatimonadaceae bacterium]